MIRLLVVFDLQIEELFVIAKKVAEDFLLPSSFKVLQILQFLQTSSFNLHRSSWKVSSHLYSIKCGTCNICNRVTFLTQSYKLLQVQFKFRNIPWPITKEVHDEHLVEHFTMFRQCSSMFFFHEHQEHSRTLAMFIEHQKFVLIKRTVRAHCNLFSNVLQTWTMGEQR